MPGFLAEPALSVAEGFGMTKRGFFACHSERSEESRILHMPVYARLPLAEMKDVAGC